MGRNLPVERSISCLSKMKEQRLVQVAREVLQTIAALSSDRPCSQTIVKVDATLVMFVWR